MKTPKASGALRWAPDPMPRYARIAHPTPLRYCRQDRADPSWAPPLTKSWIRYWIQIYISSFLLTSLTHLRRITIIKGEMDHL